MKQVCWMCKENLDISEFHSDKSRPSGYDNKCKACTRKKDQNRMYVDGKHISKRHPLFKPGRYQTFGEPWSNVEIQNKTKTGYVYIIYNQAFEGWFKVGCAVDALDRLKSYQTGCPLRDYKVAHYEYFDDREAAERDVHALLKSHQKLVQYKNEWFMIDPSVIRKVILDVKENHTRHRDQQQSGQDLGLRNRGSSNRRGNSSQDTGDPQFVIIGL